MRTPRRIPNRPRANFRIFLVTASLVIASLVTAFLVAVPASADWLVTLEGELIETRGAWTVEGDRVHYTDLGGEEQSLAAEDVDIEGSEETTAFKAGRPYVPRQPPAQAQAKEAIREAVLEKAEREAPIILYQTSWCGYCRKAEKLLESLDADFVAKDIERDPKAAAEYRVKGKGGGGVPLIDFDGDIVRGYSDRVIRRKAKEVEAKAVESKAGESKAVESKESRG